MPRFGLKTPVAILVILLGSACHVDTFRQPESTAAPVKPRVARSDILRHIVIDQCLPNARAHADPAPCAEVDLARRYAVLKDINGLLQYLYLPTDPNRGVEDPAFQAAPERYLREAWQANGWMDRKLGRPIAAADKILTLNSRYGRSQNQLHIHISCVKPQLKPRLAALGRLSAGVWQPEALTLNGHVYAAQRLTPAALAQDGGTHLYAVLAADTADARANLTLVLYPLPHGEFLLLARSEHGASAEGDFQDHACAAVVAPSSAIPAADTRATHQ